MEFTPAIFSPDLTSIAMKTIVNYDYTEETSTQIKTMIKLKLWRNVAQIFSYQFCVKNSNSRTPYSHILEVVHEGIFGTVKVKGKVVPVL
jgi:hypothetical protein